MKLQYFTSRQTRLLNECFSYILNYKRFLDKKKPINNKVK